MRTVWTSTPAMVTISLGLSIWFGSSPSEPAFTLAASAEAQQSDVMAAAASQVMVDELVTMPRENVRETRGRLTEADRVRLDRALLVFLNLSG